MYFSLHSRVEMLDWRGKRGLHYLLKWLIPKSPLLLEQQRPNDVKLLLNYKLKAPQSYVFGFVSVLLFAHKGLSSQVLALQEVQNGQLQLTALFGNSSNISNWSRQLPEQICHPSPPSAMGKFNLGALKSESKKDKQWFLSQGTWWRGVTLYFWRYRHWQSSEHWKCTWIESKYFNLLMSVTIIKQLIELMRHTVMNLVIAYFYIILLYGIESQLYALSFPQVKKFKITKIYSHFPLWPYILLAVVLKLGWVSGECIQGANLPKNLSLFLFCGLLFRCFISLNWYRGQVPVLALRRERQSCDTGEADLSSAVEQDFAIQRTFWSRKILFY